MEEIISYCDYCKDPIFKGDSIVIEYGKIYHKFCHTQKNTYYFYLDEEGGLDETDEIS